MQQRRAAHRAHARPPEPGAAAPAGTARGRGGAGQPARDRRAVRAAHRRRATARDSPSRGARPRSPTSCASARRSAEIAERAAHLDLVGGVPPRERAAQAWAAEGWSPARDPPGVTGPGLKRRVGEGEAAGLAFAYWFSSSSSSGTSRTTRAGTPMSTLRAGASLVTTAPAAMKASSPISMPGRARRRRRRARRGGWSRP